MQALTQGDQYSFNLVKTDGTPLDLSGYTPPIVVAITPRATGVASTTTPVTVVVNTGPTPSVASFVSSLASPPTFPYGGEYDVQFVVTYASGIVWKSRVYVLTIKPSSV